MENPEDETPADPVDDGESDVEANDGDATVTKELARHTDTQEYEGEEEEREEVGDATQPDDMEGRGGGWGVWVGVQMGGLGWVCVLEFICCVSMVVCICFLGVCLFVGCLYMCVRARLCGCVHACVCWPLPVCLCVSVSVTVYIIIIDNSRKTSFSNLS